MPPRATLAVLRAGARLLLRYEKPKRGAPPPLWHERLLLAEVASSKWVVVTPTIDIFVEGVLDPEVECCLVGPRGGLPNGLMGTRVFRLDENELDAHQGYIETMADHVAKQEKAALAELSLAARAGAAAGEEAAPGGADGVAAVDAVASWAPASAERPRAPPQPAMPPVLPVGSPTPADTLLGDPLVADEVWIAMESRGGFRVGDVVDPRAARGGLPSWGTEPAGAKAASRWPLVFLERLANSPPLRPPGTSGYCPP